MIQVQDRRYWENAEDLRIECRVHESTDDEELVGDLKRQQEVYKEAIHRLEASDASYTWFQHSDRQDVVLRPIDDTLSFTNGAEPTRAGAVSVEETGIDLKHSGWRLNCSDRVERFGC